MPKRKFFEKQIVTINKDIKKLNKRLKQFKDKINKQINEKSDRRDKLVAKQEIYNKLDFLIDHLDQHFQGIDGIINLCIEYLIQVSWCDSHNIYYHSESCFKCQWIDDDVSFKFTTHPRIEINNNNKDYIRICAMDIQDYLNVLMLGETIDKNYKDGFIKIDWTDCDASEDLKNCETYLNVQINHDECLPDCHEFDEEYECDYGVKCKCDYERNNRILQEDCPYLCKRKLKIELWCG